MERSTVLPIFTIDAFSSVPFGGNPAAVCLDATPNGLAESDMQQIAAEMNLSETAYIRLLSDQDSFETNDRFGLRWFTPTVEVPLCGHATLASSAALFFCVGNKSKRLEFVTQKSGSLFAQRDGDMISLDLPLNPPAPVQDLGDMNELIKAAIGDISPVAVEYAPAPMRKLVIRLPDSMTRSQFEKLTPATDRFILTSPTTLVGVILTLQGSGDANGCVDEEGTAYDFVSRFFAPWCGIDEDPVTGAAHTVLAGYWSKQLKKTRLYARQCSPRGGDLRITVRENEGRIDLAGPATVVLRGTFHL